MNFYFVFAQSNSIQFVIHLRRDQITGSLTLFWVLRNELKVELNFILYVRTYSDTLKHRKLLWFHIAFSPPQFNLIIFDLISLFRFYKREEKKRGKQLFMCPADRAVFTFSIFCLFQSFRFGLQQINCAFMLVCHLYSRHIHQQ